MLDLLFPFENPWKIGWPKTTSRVCVTVARKRTARPSVRTNWGILSNNTQRESLQDARTLLRVLVYVNTKFCMVIVKDLHIDLSALGLSCGKQIETSNGAVIQSCALNQTA
ncbi:MAG: hypothetical protein QOH71_924 [Blastocatellia bacterium]|nr:hypothetical protein [Blastocatellia bacterium]